MFLSFYLVGVWLLVGMFGKFFVGGFRFFFFLDFVFVVFLFLFCFFGFYILEIGFY